MERVKHSPPLILIEFIIVGGSLSGLASAISLASRGHKVTVLDDSPDFFHVRLYALHTHF